MNVLVTGAAGYIGSICAEVLLARGISVIALDNLQEGHRAAIPGAAVFCHVDLGIRSQIEEVFSRHKIDAVMHFAGEALVAKSVREPSTFYAANVACGVNLLDAMIRHDVKKLIFSSTAATYGEPETVPIPEDHRKSPINPYGKSKLVFENILADYRAYTGLQYVTLRYFNAAGASAERGEAHRVETHLIPRVLDAAIGAHRMWTCLVRIIRLRMEPVCATIFTCSISPTRICARWKKSNASPAKLLTSALAAVIPSWK